MVNNFLGKNTEDAGTKKASAVIGSLLLGVFIGWRLKKHLQIPIEESEIELPYTTASPTVTDETAFQGERSPQFLNDGVGPLFHRRYYADIRESAVNPVALMERIYTNLNEFAPSDMAVFQALDDTEDGIRLGDDYYIHIAGPWDGPVRVIEASDTSFTFITLDNHLEAGEIQFRLIDHPDDDALIRFEIRSWSRSRDWVVDFFYHRLPFAKIAQTRMWVYFCYHVAKLSEGELVDDVQVITQIAPFNALYKDNGDGERWQQYKPQLERIRALELNFDLDRREEYLESADWNIDEYEAELPSEAPGAPEDNGSWQCAKDILINYEFPDPNLISGVYVPDDPLEERVMLLEAKFLGFTFHFGVKIQSVIDEMREDDKGEAHVWGYSYTTTEDHFEMGEITFEIWKYIEDGTVIFRIHSYSRTGHIDNLLYRLGFAIFGRTLQKRFATTCLDRMQKLVVNRLSHENTNIPTPQVES